jgi:rhodanese-related sulfurtransferase
MPQNVPSVVATEVPEEAVLIDVREPDEWTAGHVPHAVHVPLGELAGRLADLPEDGQVYLVCRSGGRSARATAYLNQNGWDAVNVDGGMKAWAAAGRPMVSEEPGAQPEVI